MKSEALQELVKKIFSDETTKARFMSNPESVISQYSLTEPEKKAVLTTHARLGLVTADSTRLAAAIEPYATWI